MNEQTTQLIEKLAEKLGTKTEYLWGVLIKQAEITAWMNMGFIFGVLLFGLILFCVHLYFTQKEWYDDYDAPSIIMTVLSVIFAISLICSVGAFYEMMTCFLNPEYWALEQILEAI